MDPHIIISPPSKPKLSKNLIAGIIVGVVLLSIPLGVYLVQQRQIFKPQASKESSAPETSFSLKGPFSDVFCIKAPCPPQLSATVTPGQTFKIQILVRSDLEAANVFAAHLNFPKDLLEVTNIETGNVLTTSQTCSGLGDTSCPANYSCIENCGPPVSREGDPPPGFSCAQNGTFDPAARKRINCPICLALDTKISTPNGEIPVQNLKEGMPVYSVLKNGQKITSKLLKVSSVKVPASHQVINLKLGDGRNLQVSPGHPTADGRTSDQLKAGDSYNGSIVSSVQKVSYKKDSTYDLLPDSETGFYFANGILMGSTLKADVLGISEPSGSGGVTDGSSFGEGYFIQNWVDKKYDNAAGTITLIGGNPPPGFKTNNQPAVMATIEFKAKATGTANITFGNDSAILSNATNQNTLGVKRDMQVKISEAGSVVCSNPPQCQAGENLITGDPNPNDPKNCPVYQCLAKEGEAKGDGNGDGKIELVDLSILLSNYNKNTFELDYNNDQVVNGLDYSSMVKYLLDNGVIKSNP